MLVKKVVLLSVGWVLIVVGPVVGIIPGPGGIPITGAGVILVLSQSQTAKRVFLRYYKRYPETIGPFRRFIQRRKPRNQAEAEKG